MKNPQVTMHIKDSGSIVIELYPEHAPQTVDNFIKLAEADYYNGLIFHRVIKNFMVQGGCPDGTGMGGPGYGILGEFKSNGVVNNLNHSKGILSMARSQLPNSAGSQFFICHVDAPHLDGNYAAFGKVVEGQTIVDDIACSQTDGRDRPLNDIIIDHMEVDLNEYSPSEVERY